MTRLCVHLEHEEEHLYPALQAVATAPHLETVSRPDCRIRKSTFGAE